MICDRGVTPNTHLPTNKQLKKTIATTETEPTIKRDGDRTDYHRMNVASIARSFSY